jgi:hypothetical protein
MTEPNSTARQATDARFVEAVMAVDESYPEGTSFVAADMPDLATVLAKNLAEQRTTVVVHDDRSEVVIEPPELGRLALLAVLLLGFLLHTDRTRPRVEAGGQVVELPVGARVRWRSATALAA